MVNQPDFYQFQIPEIQDSLPNSERLQVLFNELRH